MSKKTTETQAGAQGSTQTLIADEVMQQTDVLEIPASNIQQEAFVPDFNFPIQQEVKEAPANVVLKLEETHRLGQVNIDGEDFVFDPEFDNGTGRPKGKQRKARLIKGVNTIWADEQD